MEVVQSSDVLGAGYESLTEPTEVSGTRITQANVPGPVLYVPYRAQPCIIHSRVSYEL